MKAPTQAVAKPKGEVHEGCGGQIFRAAGGRKCLKCGELLGGQKQFISTLPTRAPKTELVESGAHAVTSSSIARSV